MSSTNPYASIDKAKTEKSVAKSFSSHDTTAGIAEEVLDKSRDFHIEYNKFLSNHLSHAAIVLDEMNAPPDVARKFLSHYTEKLEGPVSASQDTNGPISNFEEWREAEKGTRSWERYASFLRYFDEDIKENGWKESVSKHAHHVLGGIIGAAIHPIIHLGLGIRREDPQMVSEGLAYLSSHYLGSPGLEHAVSLATDPVVVPPSSNTDPVSLSVELIRQFTQRIGETVRDESLVERVHDRQQSDPELSKLANGYFQKRVTTIYTYAEDYVAELPLLSLSFDGDDPSEDDISMLAHATSRVLAYLYSVSENDFFVLHGVTSWSALREVLPFLSSNKQRLEAIQHYYNALAVAYVVQRSPGLEHIQKDAAELFVALKPLPDSEAPSQADWEQVVHDSFSSTDEHTFKVVNMLRRDYDNYRDNDSIFYIAAKQASKKKDDFRFAP